MRRPTAEPEGAAPAEQDHPFEPRLDAVPMMRVAATDGWQAPRAEPVPGSVRRAANPFLCRRCNLAEAAHTTSAAPYQVTAPPVTIESERPPERACGTTQTAVDPS